MIALLLAVVLGCTPSTCPDRVYPGRDAGRPTSQMSRPTRLVDSPSRMGHTRRCEVDVRILLGPRDTCDHFPRPSDPTSDKPLTSHREGSGGRVIERTQERSTGAAGADPGGAETRGSRASNRSHQGGEGDLLTFALGVTHRSNAENHFWGLEGTGLWR